MAGGRYCSREVLPFAAMLTVEFTNVGMNVLYKAAVSKGLNYHVYMVYSYAISALILLPLAFFFHRSTRLPPFTLLLLVKFFILGFLGYTSQIMGYTGINYASPTLASAMSNLSPAFTFVLAVIFRMEKLALSTKSSRAKVVGTVVSISGAFVVTFYKGPSISSSSSTPVSLHQSVHSKQSNWMIGSLFLAVEYVLVAIWYIIQTHIMKGYPAESTVVFFYTFCVSILAAVVGFFAEEDSSKWSIRPSVALASVLCSGIFGCCLNNIVHTWALHLRGPVYVTMFKPLSIAIAAAMGVIILGDTLYLGSIIGATIIAIGFYTVMWGKTKEELVELDVDTADLESSAAQKYPPLLQSYRADATQKR
ncbi:WAT1-related protein [Sesamum angolense]|uniref:WAT1-related protein n=1 Tax=Sesamum angolense TaxID=2727404 RepID=A0AAE1WGS0_9LAMI|nr:WAT1-related protein [Sesamum angolense]